MIAQTKLIVQQSTYHEGISLHSRHPARLQALLYLFTLILVSGRFCILYCIAGEGITMAYQRLQSKAQHTNQWLTSSSQHEEKQRQKSGPIGRRPAPRNAPLSSKRWSDYTQSDQSEDAQYTTPGPARQLKGLRDAFHIILPPYHWNEYNSHWRRVHNPKTLSGNKKLPQYSIQRIRNF